jgi:sortase (surface protein transpeptidase)
VNGHMRICLPLPWCLALVWLLIGCQPAPATPAPTPGPIAVPTETQTPPLAVTPVAALTPDEATAPIRLQIPALALAVEITPMAWQVTTQNGERQAVWQVPLETVGWHLNSAKAGTAGNVIVSGHHLAGKALFAPLAAGQAKPGQQLLLTDEQGRTFVYEITEVSDPIPAKSGTEADQAQIAAYLAPIVEPQLTLITGWPQFADTHYLVVVAILQGITETPKN